MEAVVVYLANVKEPLVFVPADVEEFKADYLTRPGNPVIAVALMDGTTLWLNDTEISAMTIQSDAVSIAKLSDPERLLGVTTDAYRAFLKELEAATQPERDSEQAKKDALRKAMLSALRGDRN